MSMLIFFIFKIPVSFSLNYVINLCHNDSQNPNNAYVNIKTVELLI